MICPMCLSHLTSQKSPHHLFHSGHMSFLALLVHMALFCLRGLYINTSCAYNALSSEVAWFAPHLTQVSSQMSSPLRGLLSLVCLKELGPCPLYFCFHQNTFAFIALSRILGHCLSSMSKGWCPSVPLSCSCWYFHHLE